MVVHILSTHITFRDINAFRRLWQLRTSGRSMRVSRPERCNFDVGIIWQGPKPVPRCQPKLSRAPTMMKELLIDANMGRSPWCEQGPCGHRRDGQIKGRVRTGYALLDLGGFGRKMGFRGRGYDFRVEILCERASRRSMATFRRRNRDFDRTPGHAGSSRRGSLGRRTSISMTVMSAPLKLSSEDVASNLGWWLA